MMYFIESVTTYSTSGKSRKGAAIQAAARKFEHALLSDGTSLISLVSRLRDLVNVCNENFRGALLYISWTRDGESGQISIHPKSTGSEPHVVNIHYAPVIDRIPDFRVEGIIGDAIRTVAPEIYSKYLTETEQGDDK